MKLFTTAALAVILAITLTAITTEVFAQQNNRTFPERFGVRGRPGGLAPSRALGQPGSRPQPTVGLTGRSRNQPQYPRSASSSSNAVSAKGLLSRHGLNSSQHQAEFTKMSRMGYRLTYIDSYCVNGNIRYATIWERKSGPVWSARHGMSSSQFQAEFDQRSKQGFRLVHLDGCGIRGKAYYSAIWEKRSGPLMRVKHGMTSSQYAAEFSKRAAEGYRLCRISGYGVGSGAHYAAIWEKRSGPSWKAKHGLTAAQYQAEFNQASKQGFRLTWINTYNVGSRIRYAAIWEKQTGQATFARHGLMSQQYQGEFHNHLYQGRKLKVVSGAGLGSRSYYAAIWENRGLSNSDLRRIDEHMTAYLKKCRAPGISIAIAKDGRLVFAKGYGYANPDTQEKVNPIHRFRVASVSKPITAVAIMNLVEQGQLSLNQKVFGSGAILGTDYGTAPYSSRLKQITVQHLLEHTSRLTVEMKNAEGKLVEVGPMFRNLSYNHSQLIGWVLDKGTVKKTPGTEHKYSNFGYCVLGRIIEKVTGQDYEDYVRNHVLRRCGITQMELGASKKSQRKPNEVVYDGSAYGLLPARMDAHGGWIATPIDLLRFAVRVDNSKTKSDILKSSTLGTMFTVTTAKNNSQYAKGWVVTSRDRNHNGSMSGTAGILVIRIDGYCFAVLRNSRACDPWSGDIKKVMNNILKDVRQWPTHDLF